MVPRGQHAAPGKGYATARGGREPPVGVMARIRAVVAAFRPADPEFAAALARRWAELPETARTPGQLLGRHAVGCEGTHGVFPKCNLACTPSPGCGRRWPCCASGAGRGRTPS